MRTATPLDAGPSIAAAPKADRGWAVFVGVMFLLAAGTNALYGIAAISEDSHFQADELVAGNLTVWGILALLFAAFQVTAAVLILRQRYFGAYIGLMLVVLHALGAMASIGAYPLWSAVVLVIDGLIIYALSVHATDWD